MKSTKMHSYIFINLFIVTVVNAALDMFCMYPYYIVVTCAIGYLYGVIKLNYNCPCS